MGPRRFLFLLFALAMPAGAQTIVTSPGPDHVAVTVYRNPGRAASDSFDRNWLQGYALISETRRVTIPAGESELRFEGVAEGLVPQSVIVGGFPEGIVERNRDAYLLSPGTLLDRSLGRRVMLRRTSRATGATREQEAVIRSGADGAVVLQTADGFEALRCTGLPETLSYGGVPPGLSARPTLSVRARSSAPVTATLTLSYLASGFDWQADYVANLSADGSRIDLFAWLTLASNDGTSFVDADAQAVAGRLNREEVRVQPLEAPELRINCWPQGRTHWIPPDRGREDRNERRRPDLDSPVAVTVIGSEEISMNGARYMEARQEDLGDLKLYRIPAPVTVAANAQKQVALLDRPGIPVAFVYRQRFHAINVFEEAAVGRLMVTRNRGDEGLGIPLPAGRLMLFDGSAGRPILVGQGFLDDLAVGDRVEVRIGDSPGLRSRLRRIRPRGQFGTYELTVTNDGPRDLVYEAEIGTQEVRIHPASPLGRREDRLLWSVTVPANGSMSLRYRAERDD
jgi:hypothetical protein